MVMFPKCMGVLGTLSTDELGVMRGVDRLLPRGVENAARK